MTTLTKCPSSLAPGFDTYSPQAAHALFGHSKVQHTLEFDIDELRDIVEITESMHRISVSGVQEKFPAIVDSGKIHIAAQGERSTHILKPAPWDKTLRDRKMIPANEHLTMQIASQVYGIPTAANGLCFTPKGQSVYITRRFDILTDGSKLPMEDFASLIGKNENTAGVHFKYSGCYEDIANAIKQNVAAWMVELERLFALILFNYIYANGDAHLKNFSLILSGQDYRLAPAYDLLNTALHIQGDDFGLDGGLSRDMEQSDVMDRTGHPCRLDFEQFGLKIGLRPKRINKILDKFTVFPPAAQQLVEQSFLPNNLKRHYIQIVQERISRFIRLATM